MKTLSKIKKQLLKANERIEKLITKEREALRIKVFGYYDECKEVQKVLSDLQNFNKGNYSIEDFGDLVYSVKVPDDLADMPLINDYLTQDYGFILPYTKGMGNDLRLGQFCGEYISVDFEHDRNSFFVYDHGINKPVIEKRLDWMDDNYIKMKIELWQQRKGEFNDVIVIDRYGAYVRHFEMNLSEGLHDIKKLESALTQYEGN